jgi:hypothetical protein
MITWIEIVFSAFAPVWGSVSCPRGHLNLPPPYLATSNPSRHPARAEDVVTRWASILGCQMRRQSKQCIQLRHPCPRRKLRLGGKQTGSVHGHQSLSECTGFIVVFAAALRCRGEMSSLGLLLFEPGFTVWLQCNAESQRALLQCLIHLPLRRKYSDYQDYTRR